MILVSVIYMTVTNLTTFLENSEKLDKLHHGWDHCLWICRPESQVQLIMKTLFRPKPLNLKIFSRPPCSLVVSVKFIKFSCYAITFLWYKKSLNPTFLAAAIFFGDWAGWPMFLEFFECIEQLWNIKFI